MLKVTHFIGIRIKSPRKKSPRKIPLNAVEREPVETRVLNPNASKASYKPKKITFLGRIYRGGVYLEPKQHSYRKTKLKINRQ